MHKSYLIKHATGKERIVTVEQWLEVSARSQKWTIIERYTDDRTEKKKEEMPVAKLAKPKEEVKPEG